MSDKPKYATLAELRAAYESGELDGKESPLVLDNDSSHVYVRGEDESGVDDVCVYRGEGYEIREEALDLLGIPWEHC